MAGTRLRMADAKSTPEGSHQRQAGKQRPQPVDMPPEEMPNLSAYKRNERHEHIKRAMDLGLTESEAEAHADQEMQES